MSNWDLPGCVENYVDLSTSCHGPQGVIGWLVTICIVAFGILFARGVNKLLTYSPYFTGPLLRLLRGGRGRRRR